MQEEMTDKEAFRTFIAAYVMGKILEDPGVLPFKVNASSVIAVCAVDLTDALLAELAKAKP